MKRADGLKGVLSIKNPISGHRASVTYMTLDTSNEQLVNVGVRVLDEVDWGLLSGNGDKGNTFVGRLEPNNLGALNRSTTLFITAITLSLTSLCLLLLLGGSR